MRTFKTSRPATAAKIRTSSFGCNHDEKCDPDSHLITFMHDLNVSFLVLPCVVWAALPCVLSKSLSEQNIQSRRMHRFSIGISSQALSPSRCVWIQHHRGYSRSRPCAMCRWSFDIFEDVKGLYIIINKIYFIYIIRYVWKMGRDLWHLVQLWKDSAHRCLSCQSESLPQVSHCDLVPKFSARQRRHSLSESGYQFAGDLKFSSSHRDCNTEARATRALPREVFVDVITPFGATTTKSIQVRSAESWISLLWMRVDLHANEQILVLCFCPNIQYHR